MRSVQIHLLKADYQQVRKLLDSICERFPDAGSPRMEELVQSHCERFPDADPEQVRKSLESICEQGMWHYPRTHDYVLTVQCHDRRFYDEWSRGENSWFDEEYWAVERAIGAPPEVFIELDVSGRHPGEKELSKFAGEILSKFDGFAMDEYTDHPWTLDEIRRGVEIEGHPFFDYLGWYKERHPNGPF